MRAGLIGLLVVLAIIVVVALNSVFVINPTQQALVLQFGEVRQALREPGLNTKIPLVQDVLFLDKRVLDLNAPAQEIIAADQKRLVVDAFMRYRIANPVRFYQTVNNVREASTRLSTFVQSALRAVLAEATFEDIVRDARPELMQRIANRVSDLAQDIGVQVVDVRIRRADLPEANSEAIYRRMQTERQQEAREIRAQGQEAAQRVRAAADRTATVLRAEAERESEQVRGQGDAQKSAIFARAFSQDPQFFAFYRAMQAYERGLRSSDTRLVLSPDAEFFRYFNDPLGAATAAGASSATGAATTIPGNPDVRPTRPSATGPQAGATPAAGDGAERVGQTGQPPAADAAAGSAEQAAADVNAADSEPVIDGPPVDPTVLSDDVTTSPDAVTGPVEQDVEENVEAAIDEVVPSDEASTGAAVIAAEPEPSTAANAAAGGVAGVTEERPGIAEVQRGTVTIVRPGEGGDAQDARSAQ